MRVYMFCILLFAYVKSNSQPTPFEYSGGKESATYQECIDFYMLLQKKFPQIKVLSYGKTDAGLPLHLVVISKSKEFRPEILAKQNKSVLLINNGIHPGEPDGIDASMMFTRDLLANNSLPDNVVIIIIPIYNIGGALNRSATSRANQNGPAFYGFRGSAKNLDLNRDFIKSDSQNSVTFQQIFNEWNPHAFVDTHVSNGADYSYTMTLIETQKDKIHPLLSEFMNKELTPFLYQKMQQKGFEMIPYVNHLSKTPDDGISGFLETPRYATGYTTLHNTIGYITETHMLKPYQQRCEATLKFLEIITSKLETEATRLIQIKKKADELVSKQNNFALSYHLNEDSVKKIDFKGYTAKYKNSEVTGEDRLYYDRNDPYQKKINYYHKYDVSLNVEKPLAYIIPQAWERVIELLKINGVQYSRLKRDTTIMVASYYIKDYKTLSKPYEGHYLHHTVSVRKVKNSINYFKGDYLIETNQIKNRYIIETLEPQATDSFFNWNFFDSILGQKEYFSDYVFEDLAADLLKRDPQLQTQFEEAKKNNVKLSKNAELQLNWIYEHSPYFEKTYLRYPVARLETP